MRAERTTHIRARFGLDLSDEAPGEREETLLARARAAALALHKALAPGGIAFITGSSGSGKSLIARQLAHIAPRALTPPTSFVGEVRAPIDLMVTPLEQAAGELASAGLADAHQLVTPARLLSVGQQARLGLAIAFERAALAAGPCTVVADEFASTLDRVSAISLARCVRTRLSERVRFVAISAHDDLIEPLQPDVLVYVPLEGAPEIHERDATCHEHGASRPTTYSNASGAGRAPR